MALHQRIYPRKQQSALLNTDTGELWDPELSHAGDDVGRFYAALPPPVTVGIKHRLRLVRIRAMIKKGLPAIALNQRLALGPSLWSRQGLVELRALVGHHQASSRTARYA